MNVVITLSMDSDIKDRFDKLVESKYGGDVFGAKAAEMRKAFENHIKLMEAQKK